MATSVVWAVYCFVRVRCSAYEARTSRDRLVRQVTGLMRQRVGRWYPVAAFAQGNSGRESPVPGAAVDESFIGHVALLVLCLGVGPRRSSQAVQAVLCVAS
jgi:hypothetical protein